MKTVSIRRDTIVVELTPWDAAWLAQACQAAGAICFGDGGEQHIPAAADRAAAPMTGYLFEGLGMAFEALAAAGANEWLDVGTILGGRGDEAHRREALAIVRDLTRPGNL